MKILIVEDNEDSRIFLETLLEANGYDVESAENGKLALEMASTNPPSLIISDILMPEMDGYALCRAVKSDKNLCSIPFIFYTATYTDPSDEKLAMDLGASRFILKPMEINPFLLEIKTVLESFKENKLLIPEKPLKSRNELNNAYTNALSKKLEKKVRQLEQEKTRLAKVQESLQQARKMEAIGTLAGGIAHDFNNMLSPIIGYTEMTMMDLPEDSVAWQNLQQVLIAANQARELARQVLTFSRQTKKDKKRVQLQVLIKDALKLLRSSIPVTIEIRQSIDSGCDAISGDPTQIHQILINLFTNACYSMREKGGILAISLTEMIITPDNYLADLDLATGKYLRLEISDTGIGIDKEQQPRIFEPYFTTKPRDEGTGLGLSVVHGIVASHGGHITMYSEPGQGTTFQVYLPAIVEPDIEDKLSWPESAPSTYKNKLHLHGKDISNGKIPGGTERILLVDDDEIVCDMEKKQLERLGYQVVAITSGIEAINIFHEAFDSIDLVITDMTMPDITGEDLSRELLKIKPDIPIILCTGLSQLIDKDKSMSGGIQEYLMKPVTMEDMARTVRSVLDKK
ncbi:Histidine kinase [Desulfamplus magnetovallimortis]|uniref:histidine kinase n=1 Tax=Desulfamplus magnetovallimortis TaxID=1246637 RepID=A0A1W1H6S1_9BACT|nr:response regulator [Desulfamplus magnetovallimortis]SLM28181.1 Histidine kinase [Desulfamplus magnetovallimortis]